ncbi:MAG: LysR family transcriptional regulator, partial [Kordiimonas sp.]
MIIFLAVAEARSFTGAAQLLGVTKSAVSHAVNRLEADTGHQLLLRT